MSNVQASGETNTNAVSEARIQELEASLRGALIRPGDPDYDEANITWVREFIADMQEFSDASRYLNFPGFQEEGDEMMRQAFGPQYERLVALKKKYDPTNLFNLNQNIKPTA